MKPLAWGVVLKLFERRCPDLCVNGVKIHAIVTLIQGDRFVDDFVTRVLSLLNFRFEVGLHFPKSLFLPSWVDFSIDTFVFLSRLLLSDFQL